MRILVTAGGTEEKVDAVRRLTNLSSGRTGATLARHFADEGAEVLLLHGRRASLDAPGCATETFLTYADLDSTLHRHLAQEPWDAVVHLAAVSDYSVASIHVDGREVPPGGRGKIGTGREVVLRLEPNPKIIAKLRSWSLDPTVLVIGFKLTDDTDPERQREAIAKLFDQGGVDHVVHNDLSGIDANRHEAAIWSRDGVVERTSTKDEMAAALWRLIIREEHS